MAIIKNHYPAVILGAGPAGLSAAHELTRRGVQPLVVEKTDKVGGLARTEVYRGIRFDIGGHRFFTKVQEIQRLWEEVLGDDFIRVGRLSRIFYDGKFFNYPLEPWDSLNKLGLAESLRAVASYLKARVRPLPREDSFEEWVTNRFGRRLYRIFFKAYTEKVWGIPCAQIRADWAAQRIRGLSLKAALLDAFGRNGSAKSLTREFHYPRLGPGMMWERFRERVEAQGGRVLLNADIERLVCEGGRIRSALVRCGEEEREIGGDHFISSIPLPGLVDLLPEVPAEVKRSVGGLSFRAFLLVGLILDREDLFPDNWIYVHSPEFRAGRVQNFRNWSADMVPDPKKTSLGVEYFCSEGDDLWSMEDGELVELAGRELEGLGLAKKSDVEDGVVIRQSHAYPVYDQAYQDHLRTGRDYLKGVENLQTIGRNGMHRYNNQDHSMLTGLLAARNLLGEKHDLWEVNVERSYAEEMVADA